MDSTERASCGCTRHHRCLTRPLQLTWPSVAALLRGHAAERQSLAGHNGAGPRGSRTPAGVTHLRLRECRTIRATTRAGRYCDAVAWCATNSCLERSRQTRAIGAKGRFDSIGDFVVRMQYDCHLANVQAASDEPGLSMNLKHYANSALGIWSAGTPATWPFTA
jgi:hypothetical protein